MSIVINDGIFLDGKPTSFDEALADSQRLVLLTPVESSLIEKAIKNNLQVVTQYLENHDSTDYEKHLTVGAYRELFDLRRQYRSGYINTCAFAHWIIQRDVSPLLLLMEAIDDVIWILGEYPIKVTASQKNKMCLMLEFPGGTTVGIFVSREKNPLKRVHMVGGTQELSYLSNQVPPWQNLLHTQEIISKENFKHCLQSCLHAIDSLKPETIECQQEFRYYPPDDPVSKCYLEQRKNQTLEYYQRAVDKYCRFDSQGTFWELFDFLSTFVDLSDPDTTLSNHQHLFQCAERIRQDGLPRWFQLLGLIHDLGKIIYRKGCQQDGTTMDNQWGIVGDTFILGCQIPPEIVYPEFNQWSKYATASSDGIYTKGCGLSKLKCSFGHDEYLYRLLKFNRIPLPEQAYYVVRYHSLYLWHQNNQYQHLEDATDKEMKFWVRMFQKYDLYSKSNTPVDIPTVKPYYEKLVKEYFPESIYW